MPTPNDSPEASRYPTRLWFGIAVIVLGILLALGNLDVPHEGLIHKLWPVVLIIVGIGRLDRRAEGRSNLGIALILGGIILLLVNFDIARQEVVFPLFLVGIGILVVTKALRKTRSIPPDLARHENFVSSTAIFSGSKRRITQQDFKGAELTVIFGGFDLDLRQTTVDGAQVRVDVFVLFGGGELRVPADWAVTMKGSAIMGGFEDKTLPVSAVGGPRVHLVITGLVLFGGMTVTN